MLIEKPVGAEHFDELFAVSPELTQSEAGVFDDGMTISIPIIIASNQR